MGVKGVFKESPQQISKVSDIKMVDYEKSIATFVSVTGCDESLSGRILKV
jgi:hypothetical protein